MNSVGPSTSPATSAAPAAPVVAPVNGAVAVASAPAVTAERRDPRGDGGGPDARRAFEAVAKQIEDYVRQSGRSLQFQVDEGSGRIVVSVRDAATGELIRQIPDEALLALARRFADGESGPGLLVDEAT
jgi:flagellar protein FlaG